MPKKNKLKKFSSGDKQSVAGKEASGITESHNWALFELGFGENFDMMYRDIQSSRHGILPAKVLFPDFALTSVRKEAFKTSQRINQVQSEKLAEAGFMYSEDGNKVLCYCCGVSLDGMNLIADPWVEHANLYSTCPHVVLTKGFKFNDDIHDKERGEAFICANSNENVSELNEPDTVHIFGVAVVGQFGHSDSIIRQEVIRMNRSSEDVKIEPYQLGILPVEKTFPDYAVVSTRIESFKNWPKYIPVKSNDLAEAGFFYGGIGDTVKCYYCGGGLFDWKPGDEPWTEHAKWYPRCPHLVLNKGTEFIKEIMNIGVVSKPKESDLMDSPAVAAVRGFVDNEAVVRQAVEHEIKFNDSKDIRTITAQDLMKIVEDIRKGKASIPVGDETREHAETILKLAPGSIRKPTTGEGNKEDMEKIQMEKERLDEQRLCKICLKARARVMFLPCRHCMSCPQCAPALKECPELVCMKEIKGLVRIVF